MTPKKRVVILGAGITGLGAAHRLSQDPNVEVHVIDREMEVGGVCRSFTDGDFILDYGPHKFYTLLEGILDEVKSVVGDEFLERDKHQSLYMYGKYYDFPLKMSEMLLHFPLSKSLKVLGSYGAQVVKNGLQSSPVITYEDYIVSKFGRGLYAEIFEPMARKVFGNPEELDRKLAEIRISSKGLMSVVKQLLLRSNIDKTISAPVFHYPKHGFGVLPKKFKEASERRGVKFHLGARLLSMPQAGKRIQSVVFENKSGETVTLEADYVIYTIPLTALSSLVRTALPSAAREALAEVKYRNTIIFYYLLKSKPLLPSMWVFFPESKFRFGRLSEMVQFSPYTAPPGHTSLMVDFTCEEGASEWNLDDAALDKMLYQQLQPLKLFDRSQIIKCFSKRFRSFYPTYSIGYQDRLLAIRSLEKEFSNLFFIGRLGDFNYNNSDQCLDMGFRVAEHIRSHGDAGDEWHQTRKTQFETYRIVD